MKTLIIVIIVLLSVATTPWTLKKALDRRLDQGKAGDPQAPAEKARIAAGDPQAPGGRKQAPAGREEERKLPMRKILIVIDMQKDFIDGALGTPEAVEILPNVRAKIRRYAPEDIFVTKDTHQADYLTSQEGRNLPVEHCIKGTEGWEIPADLAVLLKGASVYEKPTFGSMKLAEDLKAIAEKEEIEIELAGLCTDICVVSNALLLKAAMPEVPIKVDPACCAGVTPQKHQAALETMRSCQIIIEES